MCPFITPRWCMALGPTRLIRHIIFHPPIPCRVIIWRRASFSVLVWLSSDLCGAGPRRAGGTGIFMSIRAGMSTSAKTTALPQAIGTVGNVISGARRRIAGMPGNPARCHLGRRTINFARRCSVRVRVRRALCRRGQGTDQCGPGPGNQMTAVNVRCRRVPDRSRYAPPPCSRGLVRNGQHRRVPHKSRCAPPPSSRGLVRNGQRRRAKDRARDRDNPNRCSVAPTTARFAQCKGRKAHRRCKLRQRAETGQVARHLRPNARIGPANSGGKTKFKTLDIAAGMTGL